jgi:hypothetical protein
MSFVVWFLIISLVVFLQSVRYFKKQLSIENSNHYLVVQELFDFELLQATFGIIITLLFTILFLPLITTNHYSVTWFSVFSFLLISLTLSLSLCLKG